MALHTAEKANKMLQVFFCQFDSSGKKRKARNENLPESDAETPNGLHLKAIRLGCPNPVAVADRAAFLIEVIG